MQAENSPSRKQLIVQYAIGMIVGIVLGLISAYFIRQYYFKPSVPSIEIAYPQDIPYDKENAETLSSIHTSAAIIQESYLMNMVQLQLITVQLQLLLKHKQFILEHLYHQQIIVSI